MFKWATFWEIQARWWKKYLSKRSPLKHTCSWRDKLIVLSILNRQAKIFVFYENFKILKLCKMYKNFVSKAWVFAIRSQQIMKQHYFFTNWYLKSCILQALCTSHTDFEITCHPNDKDNLEEYVTPALSTKSMNLCTEQLKKNQFCLIRCNLHALYYMWYSDGC